MAKSYQTRPSQIVGIADEWAAFQFDEVCLIVGTDAEQEALEEARKGRSSKSGKHGGSTSSGRHHPKNLRELLGGSR